VIAGAFVGLSTVDLVYRVGEPPAAGRKVQASSQEIAAGGPAANAAVTFAALRAATGTPVGETVLVTALGRHPLAALAAAELGSRSVMVLDAAPVRTEPPAVSSAWVAPGGERSVVSVNAGGVDAVPPDPLADIAAAAPVLLVDGHHPRLAVAAACAARAADRPVLLDGGSWKPALDDLLPLVDLAVCSADFRLPGAGSPEESAVGLRRRYRVPVVAVTAGPAPVRWWRDGAPAAGEVPVPTVAARDTLGAGDAFHGALAWAIAVRGAAAVGGVGGGGGGGAAAVGGAGSVGGAAPAGAAGSIGGAVATAGGVELVAALGFAAAVAAVRCETAGPRRWLADPRLSDLAHGWLARL
jgi:sugar/nucleoside kinase (ribokinase family)